MESINELVVLTTGGTIAMSSGNKTPNAAGNGVTPQLTGEDLLSSLPDLPDPSIRVRVENFSNMPGGHLTLEDLWRLADRIRVLAREKSGSGFVITMGTDILEEAVYFLDLLVGDEAPLAMTGAMRAASQLGYEGPANLYQAMLSVLSPEARSSGALLVMNEEIHAGRDVQKSHSTNPATFISPGWGPIGWIVENRAWIRRRLLDRETIPGKPPFPRVELITCTAGMDDFMVDALMEKKVDGLVVQALGVGHVSVPVRAALSRAVDQGISVVFTSRCPMGTALTKTYGFPGSESDLIARGLLPARGLTGPKARIKLVLTLSTGEGLEGVRKRFSI